MPRGRPKKKPNVDTSKEVEAMVKEACQLLIEPFDDRVPRSDDLPSMNSVAEEMGVTIIKLKRLLITGGFYSSSTSRAVQEKVARGMSMEQICAELNIRPPLSMPTSPIPKVPTISTSRVFAQIRMLGIEVEKLQSSSCRIK